MSSCCNIERKRLHLRPGEAAALSRHDAAWQSKNRDLLFDIEANPSQNNDVLFHPFLLADSAKYLDWGANLYARGPFERHFANPYLDDERRERFESAVSRWDEGKFAEAAEKFEKLIFRAR